MGLANGHLQTMIPHLFRKVDGVRYVRERVERPDGDFVDIDISRTEAFRNGTDRAVIVLHGMEGCSRREYVVAAVRAFNRRGWDAVAYNFRGCSGVPNRLVRAYHSGETGDLQAVVEHVLEKGRYRTVALVGFSLGGNMVLKYLGERCAAVPPFVKCAVAVSVPCDLAACERRINAPENRIYLERFLGYFREKIRIKMALFPGEVDDAAFASIRTLADFDDHYTAPMSGFADARDYYARCSSRQFLPGISVPTLVINARNDPLLPEACFPLAEAEANPNLYLETPESGGHVGFIRFSGNGEYWHERRAAVFAGFWAGD